MATTMRDIKRKASAAHASPPVRGQAVPPTVLPLDTCGACEASLFGQFEAVAAGDDGLYMSANRRKREETGDSQPRDFKCRQCGRIMRRLPDGVDGQVTTT